MRLNKITLYLQTLTLIIRIMTKLKFSEKITLALIEQGRTKTWLSEKLGIHQQAIYKKLRSNCFSVSEIYLITTLLKLED